MPYFLSTTNPIATRDQRELEALALKVFATSKVQVAKQQAAVRLKTLAGDQVPDEAWGAFDAMMDEWAFCYVLKAVNSDANHPKILRNLYSPPYYSFGQDVLGSRGIGGDNPDTIYSIVPLDVYGKYEVSGQYFGSDIDAPFQIVSNLTLSMTVDLLPWEDIDIQDNGHFTITIDSNPKKGRRNHMQTTADARYLLIRDTRSDWLQKVNQYQVKRLNPPLRKQLSFDELVDRAALFIVDDLPSAHFWLAMVNAHSINQFSPAFVTGSVGGMFTARMSMARLHIKDDEALVITVNNGDAGYLGVVLMNYWQHSIKPDKQTSSLTNSQSRVNQNEATTTFVISKNDPEVYNWIDTDGLEHPRVMIRWQELPDQQKLAQALPWVTGKLIKFDALENELPLTMQMITGVERKQQINQRQAEFSTRFVDY